MSIFRPQGIVGRVFRLIQPAAVALLISSQHAVAATDTCSLENAVDVQTIAGLATADARRAGNLSQAGELINSYLSQKPQLLSCLASFNEAQSNVELAGKCAPHYRSAFQREADALQKLNNEDISAGDRQVYYNRLHGVMNRVLQSVPRECWFAQVAQQPACSESELAVRNLAAQRYRACILQGTNFLACTQEMIASVSGINPVCKQWMADNPIDGIRPTPVPPNCSECRREFQNCTVKTKGRGPCTPCTGCPL